MGRNTDRLAGVAPVPARFIPGRPQQKDDNGARPVLGAWEVEC